MNNKNNTLSYQDYVKGIEKLKPEEQLSLVSLISERLKERLPERKSKHKITELKGLGADVWRDIDTENYLREERESWD